MKRLWAPWRMEYIGGEQRPGCFFCRAIENPDDPDAALVVWRPDGAIVILNKFPYNPGHAMVAPITHVPGFEELDDDQSLAVTRALRGTLAALRKTMHPDGFNVGANLGRTAGAGVPDHVHLHVVPRWNGDTNFMAVLDDVKIVNQALDQTAEKLKLAFSAT
ncbi:MAG TPA: HIT domain-containing protein [Candidatus Dormibacteraeota bacterium]|nr:HIT domain-containing protein [Candidatus Dormibacteraeota bacterium]